MAVFRKRINVGARKIRSLPGEDRESPELSQVHFAIDGKYKGSLEDRSQIKKVP